MCCVRARWLALLLVISGPVAQFLGSMIGLSDAFQTAWDILRWPVVVVVIVLRIAARPLFQLVLGSAWLPAVPLFRIFVINMAIGALIAVLVSYLRAIGDARAATSASLIQAVVLVVVVPVATQRWGVTGIAWAMTAGLAAGAAWMLRCRSCPSPWASRSRCRSEHIRDWQWSSVFRRCHRARGS